MKKLYFALLLLFSINSFSQFSKTHYIPPLSNADAQEPQGQYLYVSSPSITDVDFKITKIGGQTISGTVSRDKPYVLDIGSGFNTQLLISQASVGKVMKNKGYIVEAEDLVYVTVRLTATKDNWQAGGLVSKGLAALGTQFRIGAFTNKAVEKLLDYHYTFATILATENNTSISFSDIKAGVSLVNKPTKPVNVILNRGESYAIAVQGAKDEYEIVTDANRDGLIGAAITSDKPIVVNCGSFAGTNGDQNLDLGFDQIVSAERTGTEYIFIKGNGTDIVERPLIVANEDDTEVYLNGSSTPYTTLSPSKGKKYIALDGSEFSANKNLYVRTSKKAFAYQCIGGTQDMANQNMHFVPPLSCETPKIINNIPFINKVGNNPDFIGTVCIVTEAGADLDFIIDGKSYALAALPASITVNGPLTIVGNPKFVTYSFKGLKGNISVFSTKQVYLSYFGSSGAATYGGFYSGFTFKPEVAFRKLDSKVSACIPNVGLSINSLTAFNDFQWFLNGNAISGATGSDYVPTQPGSYSVRASIVECGTNLFSDNIPVSSCAPDIDQDGVNDNVDIDNDNDGIANCTESLGDKSLDLSASAATINQGTYTNSFTSTTTVTGVQLPNAFSGKTDGTFVSEAVAGKDNSLKQTFTFAKPVSLSLEYVTTAKATDLLSSTGDFILEVPVGNTITVLNPSDQLLIDTNYDGVYESGITEYSSFQLRFRLNNGGKPLAAGTGTFKFMSRLVSSFSFTHKDLSDLANNRATFKLSASCLPKDTDKDGIIDELDLDDDNDGIPDLVEVLGKNYAVSQFKDVNKDGMNDIYPAGLGSLDSDKDGVSDYQDLDSDNDGIYDLIEAGHKASDVDNNGIIDGNPAAFGTNGFFDSLETASDSGIMNYTVASVDVDSSLNYIDSDSDGDGCLDVIEAGFSDKDGDGYLGEVSPVLVNANGKVTSGTNGYTTLLTDNYVVAAPIVIQNQPLNQTTCDNGNAAFTISTDPVDGYQWQIAKDGTNYSDITDNIIYSGSKSDTLRLNKVTFAMNSYKYRVSLNKNGNSCGLVSAEASLNVLIRPQVAPVVTLVQCDNDTDGFSDFNIKQIENQIAINQPNVTFTYFTSLAGAESDDPSLKIGNPTVYHSDDKMVWARVENTNGCFSISEIDLKVSVTQIPANTVISLNQCDDNTDGNDSNGITTFDLQSASTSIKAMLPNNADYEVKFYETEQDALQETDEQGNSLAIASNYTNAQHPNSQTIWARIDSSIPNSCVGLGPYVLLTVNALPNVELNHEEIICSGTNQEITLTAGLKAGSKSDYSYEWFKNGNLMSSEKGYDTFVKTDGIYTCVVKDITTGCQKIRTNTVAYSETVKIEDVMISDFTVNNIVTVKSSYPENSEYSLDNPTGAFQDSNVFENIEPGIHTVYVNDKSGCGIVSKTFGVVGAPAFFTPNGDGQNEYWKLIGVNSTFNKNTSVDIMDRFGKLIKVLPNAQSDGWDGSYDGSAMPSDDYWFVAHLEDGRQAKGHFALMR